MKLLKLFTITSLFVIFLSGTAQADDPIYTGTFSSTAIDGYDTVSYFSGSAPVKGSSDHKTKWRGATWKFSSAENLAKFEADQEKYAPQYGGYCAWAMSSGNFAPGDAEVYEVYNGKLYLNYNEDVKAKWVQDKDGFIAKADEKYPALVELN